MIWAKTDAGRAEMKAKSLVHERAQRNLLLLIDGKRPDEKLLADLAGITPADFATLEGLGLIAPVTPHSAPAPEPAPKPSSEPVDADVNGFDYATLRGAIGRVISNELGMRGFALSMILEESTTVDDLQDVAKRVLKAIAERKGLAAAEEASRVLFGR